MLYSTITELEQAIMDADKNVVGKPNWANDDKGIKNLLLSLVGIIKQRGYITVGSIGAMNLLTNEDSRFVLVRDTGLYEYQLNGAYWKPVLMISTTRVELIIQHTEIDGNGDVVIQHNLNTRCPKLTIYNNPLNAAQLITNFSYTAITPNSGTVSISLPIDANPKFIIVEK